MVSDIDGIGPSYDRIAQRYAQEIGRELQGKPLDRALLDAIAELAGSGLVLDLGCGPGHVSRYLSARGASCVGLDLSPAMCQLANDPSSGLRSAVADMTAVPVRSGVAAAVVALYSVIHLAEPDRRRAYEEFARVLSPGGIALIGFHVRDADSGPGENRRMFDWWGQPIDLTFHFLDPSVEIELLADAGLRRIARLDRTPIPNGEHPSERSYILVQRD